MNFKNAILILSLFLVAMLPACAEKIPVRIAPLQAISTNHDEVEIGDWIKFEVAEDVYVNDKLYLKKNTEVTGIVDFVHPNGWGGDCAQIYFKKFYTNDVNNKKVEIDYPVNINGKSEMATASRDVPEQALTYIPRLFYYGFYTGLGLTYVPFVIRGSEIFVEPDTKTYNLFMEQL